MEATGCYGDALATYLHEQGCVVSVVNPAQIKSFGGAQLRRAKTDKTDAKLIAQFCQDMHPAPWTPHRCMCESCRRWCIACPHSRIWKPRNRIDWELQLA